MTERGSGRTGAEIRRPLTTEDIKKHISDVTGKLADKLRQDMELAVQETKSEMQV